MFNYQNVISNGLKDLGIVSEEQARQALGVQKKSRKRLSRILMEMGYISNEDIVGSLVSQFGITPERVKPETIPQAAIALVDYEFAVSQRVIPLKFKDNVLSLGTDNLFNFLARDNFQEFLKVDKVEMAYIETQDFGSSLPEIYTAKRGVKPAPAAKQKIEQAEASEFLRQAGNVSGKDDAPVIKLAELLFAEAYQGRASDVHLEPLEESLRIRYRTDGVLREVPGPPKRLQGSLISRVKIMAGMDIAEKRLPQDGRIKFNVENKQLDLRVSTIPVLHGESVVIRILDSSRLVLDLESLGFSPEDKARYEDLIKLPNGIILVCGPTGCGKTTTLYTSLSQINKPNKKLLTLEDPVEYQLTGINQVQVKPDIGLTFASGLRSMLRQAPDVIMVGEIRDFETAAIAIQASLTGHLIFSTLHTNDAPGAIIRLIDMGVKPYLAASTLQGILAQRLIRTLCPDCRQSYNPKEEELKAFGKSASSIKGKKFYRPKGCPKCSSTGFRGRIGIFELLILDDQMRSQISEQAISSEVRDVAKKSGMHSLREDGWLKAAQGTTSLAEVLRVTQQ